MCPDCPRFVQQFLDELSSSAQIAVGGGLAASVILCLVLLYCCCCRGRHEKPEPKYTTSRDVPGKAWDPHNAGARPGLPRREWL